MSWEGRILDAGPEPAAAIENLFVWQLASWPLLRDGLEGLGRARSRAVTVDGFRLVAWHIPHRIRSTTARVDEASVEKRPCFLCPHNLPREERAVALDAAFVIACNPYPIRERHVSVLCREHRPQEILGTSGDFRTMLDLARALPDYLVLYNGPECGASAPDHMHFQACRRAGVPLMDHLGRAEGGIIDGYPAGVLVLRDSDPVALGSAFGRLMMGLGDLVPGAREPMVNVASVYEGGWWNVLVFPRLRHRPAAYFSGELTWSPGALDLTGVIVLPVEEDLGRIGAGSIRSALSEVCLSGASIRRLAAELGLP